MKRARPIARVFAVLTAVLLIAAGCGGRPADDEDRSQPSPIPFPAAAAGFRWVGAEDVVIQVPATWVNEQPACSMPTHDFVSFPSTLRYGCPLMLPRKYVPIFSLFIGVRDASTGPLIGQPGPGGLVVEHSPRSCSGPSCTQSFAVAGSSVLFVLTAPKARAAAELAALIASVRRLPAGLTTVPFLDGGTGLAGAFRLLGHRGLRPVTAAKGDPTAGVAGTDPPAGTVVRRGAIVRVLLPASY